ncbi:MAG: glycosyltransferase family 9 protein [Pirellulales bacterium]
MLSPRTPARILIVRLSAIGDVLHGLPVLCALREALPKAFIAWVVEGRNGELLRGHRALDELIVVSRGWLKRPRAVWDLRRKLRQLKFDTTIDMQGLTKSAVAARLSDARRRIGIGGHDGRELSQWLNNERVTPQRTHVIDRNLELLRPLAIDRPAVRFDLESSPADVTTAHSMLHAVGLADRFALINPGAGWPSKIWPAERFAAVAQRLGQSRGLRSLVVWAGAQERAWAEQIAAASTGWALMAPPTSLCELAALTRRASLFVSSDTGPLHLAVAVGTPSVGLFGPMPAERNGPYGPLHMAVQKVCLSGASRQHRTAGPESMEAVTVDDVVAACERILDRQEPLAA